jgi:spermidine synthase
MLLRLPTEQAGSGVTKPGKELFRTRDEHGPIVVFEDGGRRVLTFGNEVEQSCGYPEDPLRLEFAYIQAMILALLFRPQPRRVLLLGLGGGSLARAIHGLLPGCRLQAVERRAAVVRVARDYFLLPPDVEVEEEVASAFLAQAEPGCDLIFADLYHAGGMDDEQTGDSLLQDASRILAGRGLLVLNLWGSDYRAARHAHIQLGRTFAAKVLYLHVRGGNLVAFAFPQGLPELQRRAFFKQAQSLGVRMGIPLQKQARDLWRQNAEALQIGRERRRMEKASD